jgi:1-acyl-sn-glycerol-3-phosphate acyltransferase
MTCLSGVRHFNVPGPDVIDRGILLAANHQSFLDPMLVGMALERPVHYLARKSLLDLPVFGGLIGMLNAHPLRRGRVDGVALRKVLEALRSGEPLLLFPEGTRCRDGSLGLFRTGVGEIALRCEVPVMPVCIEGAFESWPRHEALPRPARIAVAFGSALKVADSSAEDLTRCIEDRIRQKQRWLRRYVGRDERAVKGETFG